MVLFSQVNYKATKTWVDSLRIYIKGGFGGTGQPSVGGIGGRGGNIYIVPSKSVKDLRSLYQQTFKGKAQKIVGGVGENARRNKVIGEPGKDVILNVPLGIQILDDYQRVLADLDREDIKVLVGTGGLGGCAETNWMGLPGQHRHIRLDLKLIADVGLVGFPNAGKSTLLKALSKAKPKIASYPFTTIQPNLGIINYPYDRTISLADLPGLIEGASYNIGMGHRFLKHVERTRMLLFLIDISGFQLKNSLTKRSAFETIVLLNRELELYNPDLLDKNAIIVINKMDKDESKEEYNKLLELLNSYESSIEKVFSSEVSCKPLKKLKFSQILSISAKYEPSSVLQLKKILKDQLDALDDLTNKNLKSEEEIVKELKKKIQGGISLV